MPRGAIAMPGEFKQPKDEQRRFFLQDALHLSNRVQEMGIIDKDKIKKHPEVLKILSDARDNLNTIIGSGGAPPGSAMAGVFQEAESKLPNGIKSAIKKRK